MTFKEQLIIAITKETVALGKGVDKAPGVTELAAEAIVKLANAIEKEASKE